MLIFEAFSNVVDPRQLCGAEREQPHRAPQPASAVDKPGTTRYREAALMGVFGRIAANGSPAPEAFSVQLVEGLTVAERFCLVRELGRGGMGSVWLARHIALDVLCAVKFIDRERNTPEMRARFEQEAKAAAQLRSPYVVQILDHGIWQGLPYIAMEYLQGEDLAQRLDRELLLPPFEAVQILGQVGRALSRAHAAGIVHRDLKPENIFLIKDEDDEIAKVLDFGIAKRSATSDLDSSTRPGALLGTPFYMSPEQARGNLSVDHRSDLWSLAVIAYQCLTGHLPFSSEGLGDVLSQIMHDPLPVPSQVYPDVPQGFDAFWAKAASRNPDDRYQSAKDFCDALSEALEVFESIVVTEVSGRASLESAPALGVQPGLQTIAGVAAVQGTTTDTPLYNTFSREPSSGRRKKRLVIGLGAAGAVGLALWLALPSRTSSNAAAVGVTGVPGLAAPPALGSATQVSEPSTPAARPSAEPPASITSSPEPQSSADSTQPARRPESTSEPSVRQRKSKSRKPVKKRVDFGI
jgi:serine/threonine protein kinase